MEQENSHLIGGTIREIAGKSLANPDYLSLFDKEPQDLIVTYMKTKPNLEKIPLTEEDLIQMGIPQEKPTWNIKIDDKFFFKDEQKEYSVYSIRDGYDPKIYLVNYDENGRHEEAFRTSHLIYLVQNQKNCRIQTS